MYNGYYIYEYIGTISHYESCALGRRGKCLNCNDEYDSHAVDIKETEGPYSQYWHVTFIERATQEEAMQAALEYYPNE